MLDRMGRVVVVVIVSLAVASGCSSEPPSGSGGPGSGGATTASGGSGGGVSLDKLDGPDDALAADHLPDIPLTPADDYIVDEDILGYSPTHFLVVIDETATVAMVNDLFKLSGATISGSRPAMLLLDLVVAPGTLTESIELAAEHPAAAAVIFDLLGESLRLSPAHASPTGLANSHRWEWATTFGGSNWGLKFTRTPMAWNLRNRMARKLGASIPEGWIKTEEPNIAVIDVDFPIEGNENEKETSHPDLRFHPQSSNTKTAAADPKGKSPYMHGADVGIIIAAKFDATGTEGVFPLSTPLLARGAAKGGGHAEDESPRKMWLQEVERIVNGYPSVRAINISQGIKWSEVGVFSWQDPEKDGPNWYKKATYRDILDAEGLVWSRAINKLAQDINHDKFLIVCAAGNDGKDDEKHKGIIYQARDTSPCNNAAVVHNNKHFMAVEALRKAGQSNEDASYTRTKSQRGGTIAAPGENIAVHQVKASADYAPASGTSYAAPYVTGAAAILWALDPSLSYTEVYDLLVDEAKAPVAGKPGAKRLDVYASVLKLIEMKPDVGIDLVDVDDGTVDGNIRANASGAPLTSQDELFTNKTLDGRGDGCIDMADLRAFRDALALFVDSKIVQLDGGDSHIKRDLNQNGTVDATTAPDGNTTRESQWTRFDFNGDHKLDDKDLAMIAARWGKCRTPEQGETLAPQLEGHDKATLDDLKAMMRSVDYWLKIPDGEKAVIQATNAVARKVDAAQPAGLHEKHAILTATLACGGSSMTCLSTTKSGQTNKLCAYHQTILNNTKLKASQDVWSPQPTESLLSKTPMVLHTDKGKKSAACLNQPGGCSGQMVVSQSGTVGNNTPAFFLNGYDAPFMPGPRGRYVAAFGYNNSIKLVDPANGNIKYSVNIPSLAGAGPWSEDGRYLKVTRDNFPLGDDLYVIDVDVDPPTLLPLATSLNYKNVRSYFAPGGWLYFSAYGPQDTADIYRVQLAPAKSSDMWFDPLLDDQCLEPLVEAVTVTSNPEYTKFARSTPSAIAKDGKLLIDAFRVGDGHFLGVMSPDGSQLVKIPSTDEFAEVAWAPDSRHVAFSLQQGIKIVDLGDDPFGAPQNIKVTEVHPTLIGAPSFSPTSSQWLLVYTTDGNQFGLSVFDTSTSPPSLKKSYTQPEFWVADFYSSRPSWTPDGTALLVERTNDKLGCGMNMGTSPVNKPNHDVIRIEMAGLKETNLTEGFIEYDASCAGAGNPGDRPTNERGAVWGPTIFPP